MKALAAAIVLFSIAALFLVRPLRAPEAPCAYTTPVLCAELPESGAALSRVLAAPPNDRGAWVWNLALDMPFLLAYAALLALTAASFRAPASRWIVVAVIAAALCDVSENVGIYLALGAEASDAHAGWIAASAHTKFILLDLACIAIFALRSSRARSGPARVAFASLALPCVLGLGGPIAPALVEIGGLGIALTSSYALARSVAAVRGGRAG